MKYIIPFICITAALAFGGGCSDNNPKINRVAVPPPGPQPADAEHSKPQGLTGIYSFHINQTTVKDLDTMRYHHRELTIEKDIKANMRGNVGAPNLNWELLCDSIRVFEISKVDKGEIHLSNITLVFFKNVLLRLECLARGGLGDALEAKYPGFEMERSAGGLTTSWKNGSIRVTLLSGGGSEFFEIYDYNWEDIDQMRREKKRAYEQGIHTDL